MKLKLNLIKNFTEIEEIDELQFQNSSLQNITLHKKSFQQIRKRGNEIK